MREKELQIAKEIQDFTAAQDLGDDYVVHVSVWKKSEEPGWYVGAIFLNDWTQRDYLMALTQLESHLTKVGPDKLRKALLKSRQEYAYELKRHEAAEELVDCYENGLIGVSEMTDEEVMASFIQDLRDADVWDDEKTLNQDGLDEYFEIEFGEEVGG